MPLPPPGQQPPIPISITICGDGGCGKSSITLRLVRSQWTSEYDPTIEDSYSITRRIDGVTYHLSLTDTAGQEEYRGMWASSNLGADAFLLVYDITSRESLEALSYFNDLIDMEAETRLDNAARAQRAGLRNGAAGNGAGGGGMSGLMGLGGGGGGNPPLPPGLGYSYDAGARTVPPVKIVAGNKCDLQESRQVPASVGLEWARRRGCGFMETSARLEVNIEETFALLVRRVVEARRLAEMGVLDHDAGLSRRGATKPLSPLPASLSSEKGGAQGPNGQGRGPGMRGPTLQGEKVGRGGGGFWKKLRCW